MPCRPEGPDKPQECCRFNVVSDEGEDEPEIIDPDTCEGYKREAISLYLGTDTSPATSVAKICQKEADGEHWKYPTIGCTDSGDHNEYGKMKDLFDRNDADKYSLWTQCE